MKKSGTISTIKIYKRLLPYIKNHKGYLLLNLLCSLISFSIPLLFAYSFRGLTNAGLSKDFESFFGHYFYIFVTAFVVNIIVSYFRTISHNRFVIFTMRDMRNHVFSHIGKLSIPYLESKHSGDFTSRLNNDFGSVSMLLECINGIVFEPLIFIGVLIFDFTINWKLLLAAIILFPLTLTLNNLLTKVFPHYTNTIAKELASANVLIQESVEGMHVIKSFQLKQLFVSKFNDIMSKVFYWGKRIEKRNILITPLGILIIIVPMVVVNVYGGFLTVQNQMTIGDFVVFLYLLTYLTNPINNIKGILNTIRIARGSIIRIFEILDETHEKDEGKVQKLKNHELALNFNNVAFSYDDNTQVLKDISFKLKAGKKVVIVGASGSGKTTIFKLLCGFYRPTNGKIEVFEEDINNLSKKCLRESVAIVSQDTYLFPVSILENIAMGDIEASETRIIEAAKSANAHDFIMELPNAYNTIVGENGASLSGGQKQRVALARAILKDSPIVLLDEPTSALDAKTEFDLHETMRSSLKNKAVVTISHRLSTIKDTDEIIVIKDGQIVEKGEHEYLINNCEYYKNLYTIQTVGEHIKNRGA